MYQIYAYGKRYGCEAVALAYPRTGRFAHILRYRLFDGLHLICLPFDVTKPIVALFTAPAVRGNWYWNLQITMLFFGPKTPTA